MRRVYSASTMVGLDFETYGSKSMKDVGLQNYIDDPHFLPLKCRVVSGNNTLVALSLEDSFMDWRSQLQPIADAYYLACHNAQFEAMVMQWLKVNVPAGRFVDTAVVSRAVGGGAKLETAAPQLLNTPKNPEGERLIKLFSMPSKEQREHGNVSFDHSLITTHSADWHNFGVYCNDDAAQSLKLALDWGWLLTDNEFDYSRVTMEMNRAGWPVDLDLVREMQRRYEENKDAALIQFNQQFSDAPNPNSHKQMLEWCKARGVNARSFDKQHVESMRKRIESKLATGVTPPFKAVQLSQVLELMRLKQTLGGAGLKKLQVILDTTSRDGRLRDQYFHAGAGQTLRTTGRGVQMQNLARLGVTIGDMDELDDNSIYWDNNELAENIRQVFRSENPKGQLLVGDFSSVESRGLAYLSGAQWKINEYFNGADMYKVLAGKIYGKHTDSVTKQERQTGKVGELACGYGAGPGAVRDFAAKMDVHLSLIHI